MLRHSDLTKEIIGAFFTVYNGLGQGFLEKVYENALAQELRLQGLKVEQQRRIAVQYKGVTVGNYYADLYVSDLVILELKVAEEISSAHTAQLVNYLKATSCEIGFIFNFGPEAAFERRFFSNKNKNHLRAIR